MPVNPVLDSIQKIFSEVSFPHEEHIDYAEKCSVCHHQHGTDRRFESPRCGTCHSIPSEEFQGTLMTAGVAPCRSCHPTVLTGEDLMVPSLKAAYHQQCLETCHDEMSDIKGNPESCAHICHRPSGVAAR